MTAPEGKNVLKIDMEAKNSYAFMDGTTIRLERKFNNFNMREVSAVNATVVSSAYMPEGAECLIHHNSTHDVNRIFNHGQLSGSEIASDIRLFSISEEECYVWRMNGGEWNACKGFAIAERVFEPYRGIIEGIEPTVIKHNLYVKTGQYAGKVVITLKACDYEIVYQGANGREERIIRLRDFEGELTKDQYDRLEIIAIDHEATDMVNNGELLVGLTPSTARKIQEVEYA